jgi:hypothetical protein
LGAKEGCDLMAEHFAPTCVTSKQRNDEPAQGIDDQDGWIPVFVG